MRFLRASLAASVLALFASVAAARDVPREDVWFEDFLNGQKTGWSHHVVERLRREGTHGWLYRAESEDHRRSRGVEETIRNEEEVFYTLDFVPIDAAYRHIQGTQVRTREVRVRNGTAHFVKTVNGSVEEDDLAGLVPEGPYQHVVASGKKLEVTLLPQPAPEGATIPFPVDDASVAQYLKTTPELSLDDAGIRAKAREVVGEEKDALAAARRVVHWVHATLKQEISLINKMTAKEALAAGAGDCTELAAVVVAFCRAVGIPARIAHGLLWGGDLFGYHEWAEVWIGRWLPIDATRDLVGLPPAYLSTGADDDGPERALVRSRSVRLLGRVSFLLESVKEGGKVRAVSEQDAQFQSDGAQVTSFGWGVSFTLPEGWTQQLSKKGSHLIFAGTGAIHVDLYPRSMAAPLTEEGAKSACQRFAQHLTDARVLPGEMKVAGDRREFACDLEGTLKGEGVRYRLVFVEARGRMFFVIALGADGPGFDEDAKPFDSFVRSLEFP